MQLITTANCPYDVDSRLCFVLPNNCEKRFDLQKSLEDVSIMSDNYDQQAKLAAQYDHFFIDASLKDQIIKMGGHKFLTKARPIFVPNLATIEKEEALKYVQVPKITSIEYNIIIGHS